ncbi:hypothetical protein [Lentzea cavernae]|uniref:Lipoprotein n=1 Tax=Lentzea cavernae TaxID=2020703 RepID=A0ABQ3MKN8_9PSEU|nr:hypothetical protein [Lentzea cavernae]GHH48918.1 hypothetical protein GCM10017774_55470 [Lentzea cavernae]
MNRSAVLIAIVAAFGLSACTSTSAPEQNSAPAVEQPAENTPPPARNVAEVDNRLGYGALKLGMTLEEATAAGLTDLTWDSDGDGLCVGDDEVAISKKYGVVRITLPKEAKTSKGIGVGSTFAEVKRAYPSSSEYRAGWSSPIDYTAGYAFIGSSRTEHFTDTDEVVQITMGLSGADCAMYLL